MLKDAPASMLNKFLLLVKRNWIMLLILTIGAFLRAYKPLELFMYGHDEDLAGWIVKDILVNHHLRLIGQQTSSLGIFIGPYFYYLQIPFYLLTKMDPSGVLLLPFLLGIFTIFSFYYVFSKMFGKNGGINIFVYLRSFNRDSFYGPRSGSYNARSALDRLVSLRNLENS